MQGAVILESVDERTPGTLKQDTRPTLPECGFELRAMGATPVAVDVAVKRVPTDVAARRLHERHQGGAWPAKVPQPTVFNQTRAMHADRRKDKVAGRAPSFVERAQRIHVSAITLQL
jgi:hypothetical protein